MPRQDGPLHAADSNFAVIGGLDGCHRFGSPIAVPVRLARRSRHVALSARHLLVAIGTPMRSHERVQRAARRWDLFRWLCPVCCCRPAASRLFGGREATTARAELT
jgi:hypothetical protein